jgi:hypothetical protein
VLAAIGAAGALLVLLGAVTPGNMSRFIDDPTATAGEPPWTGFVSTLGVLGWALSAGVCLVTALALGARGDRLMGMFATGAALFALLGVDDAFLLHDDIAAGRLGVPENVALALLAVAVAAWAWRWRGELARTDVRLLAVVALAFGASIALDVSRAYDLEAVEEWLKLSGILALVAWCLSAALESLATLRT